VIAVADRDAGPGFAGQRHALDVYESVSKTANITGLAYSTKGKDVHDSLVEYQLPLSEAICFVEPEEIHADNEATPSRRLGIRQRSSSHGMS